MPDHYEIERFINNELWGQLIRHMEETYTTTPIIEYSCCSGQPGWNVKCKKGGKSLCTLYPMENYFIALIVIGNKEQSESELILPACSEYIQNL